MVSALVVSVGGSVHVATRAVLAEAGGAEVVGGLQQRHLVRVRVRVRVRLKSVWVRVRVWVEARASSGTSAVKKSVRNGMTTWKM